MLGGNPITTITARRKVVQRVRLLLPQQLQLLLQQQLCPVGTTDIFAGTISVLIFLAARADGHLKPSMFTAPVPLCIQGFREVGPLHSI